MKSKAPDSLGLFPPTPIGLQMNGMRRNDDAIENKSRYHKKLLAVPMRSRTAKSKKFKELHTSNGSHRTIVKTY